MNRKRQNRRGIAMVYVIMVLSVMMAFASLGVDLARVQVAKTELRRAADSAARAAAFGLQTSVTTAENEAVAFAAVNSVDGDTLSLVTASDVEFGTWSTSSRTFTVLTGTNRSSANAVRVTARKTAARGTAIPLVFARVIGRNTCDVSASAIATTAGTSLQYLGLNSVDVKNNLYAATYSSSADPTPIAADYTNGAILARTAR